MQPENQDFYHFLAQNGLIHGHPYGSFPAGVANCEFSSSTLAMPMHSFCSSSSYYPLNNLELSAVLSTTSTDTTTTTPQDRALAALNNHKEAEKRRRERINSHLDKLRSLLPCNSKVLFSRSFLN